MVQHDMVPQGGAPAKLMYAGPMFRAERPQKGRLRQFRQVGVEKGGFLLSAIHQQEAFPSCHRKQQ